jgi:hypothetical protein
MVIDIPSQTTSKVILFYATSALGKDKVQFIFELLSYKDLELK